MRRRLAQALIALAQLRPAIADADELPLDLEWDAPPECGVRDEVRAEVMRIAGLPPPRTVPRLSAQVTIRKQAEQYDLVLRTERSGAAGERKLSAPDCRSLVRDVTLVLAVAFGEGTEGDLSTTTEAGSASPAPHQPPPRPSGGAELADALPPRTSPAVAPGVHTWRLRNVIAGGGVLFNALPSPAANAFVAASFGTASMWLEPRLTWIPRVEQTLDRGVRAHYDAVAGAFSACFGAFPAPRWQLAGCARGEFVSVRARGTGAPESDSARAPLYILTAVPAVSLQLGPLLALRAEGGLGVSLNVPEFVVEGLGPAHRVPRFVPNIGLSALFSP